MFNNKFNKRFNTKFNKKFKNKTLNTNTNITVEKIDTTETGNTTKNSSHINENTKNIEKKSLSSISNKGHKSSKKETKTENKTENRTENKETTKKLTLENDIINNIETLEDLPLVLSNVSENEKHSIIDTDTLLYAKKQNKNKSVKSNKYTLDFPKTEIVDITKYNKINKYVKKNYKSIVDLLYSKNLLKNKSTPYKIVFHIYVNYLNEDLNIIFSK